MLQTDGNLFRRVIAAHACTFIYRLQNDKTQCQEKTVNSSLANLGRVTVTTDVMHAHSNHLTLTLTLLLDS